MAGLNTFDILFPTFGFLLVVGYLVSNCDLRCIISVAGIATYLAIGPAT